tara:strand:- start:4213 stop:4473 length:261 start_codon:yes stop_codon:yes gene_type:complete
MSSYSSYTPARINSKSCNEDNKTCPIKVLPNGNKSIENTEIGTYSFNMKNSNKRKTRTNVSVNVNDFNRTSGAFGGSGSPPLNKFY